MWCCHVCQTEHYPLLCLEQAEAVPSASDPSGPSALQTEQQPGSFRPQAPNLAGAVEFNDVKTLLKEWITTISGEGCHTGVILQCITKKTALSRLFVLPFSFPLPFAAYWSQCSWSLTALAVLEELDACYQLLLGGFASSCVSLNTMKINMPPLQAMCLAIVLCLDVACVWGLLWFSKILQPLRWKLLKENSFCSMNISSYRQRKCRVWGFIKITGKNPRLKKKTTNLCNCETFAKLWFELGQTNSNSLKPWEIWPSYPGHYYSPKSLKTAVAF